MTADPLASLRDSVAQTRNRLAKLVADWEKAMVSAVHLFHELAAFRSGAAA